jgi:hypothetical protein
VKRRRHSWNLNHRVQQGALVALRVDRGINRRSRWQWDWRHGYRTTAQVLAERRARDLQRWKLWSRHSTIGQPTNCTGPLLAGSIYSFRMIDKHGRAIGRRYTTTGHSRLADGGRIERLLVEAVDMFGVAHWIPQRTRVRIIDRQPEDPHSAACRALKRAHRLGMADD